MIYKTKHVKLVLFFTLSCIFFYFIGCVTLPQEKFFSQKDIFPAMPELAGNGDEKYALHGAMERGGQSLEYGGWAAKCGRWWESFASPELNELIEVALGDNFSLNMAWARLKQAKASEDSRRASLFPSITYSASMSQRESGESQGGTGTSFSAGPAASYEIDLWGSVKAGVHGYEHNTMAARFDFESAAMSVASEIAGYWFSLIFVREELALLQKQVKMNTMVQELLELRFKNSMSTALDVLQQREVVARTRARIPPVEIREVNLVNSLALLTGKVPKDLPLVKTVSLNEIVTNIPPMPEGGVASDLLVNRPDIKAAHMRLISSQWNRLQVKGESLPSLKLTGAFLLQHTSLEGILKNWILSLAANLTGDIFDGGKHGAALDLAGGVVDERLSHYQKTVYTAIMEVENAVAAEKSRMEWIALLKAELAAAQLAMEEAGIRYTKGLDPFLPFVTEQINVQNLELSLLKQQLARFQDRITLYRALGGGWTGTLQGGGGDSLK